MGSGEEHRFVLLVTLLRYTEHKQKAYLGFYLVAMILELCFGGGLKPRASKGLRCCGVDRGTLHGPEPMAQDDGPLLHCEDHLQPACGSHLVRKRSVGAMPELKQADHDGTEHS